MTQAEIEGLVERLARAMFFAFNRDTKDWVAYPTASQSAAQEGWRRKARDFVENDPALRALSQPPAEPEEGDLEAENTRLRAALDLSREETLALLDDAKAFMPQPSAEETTVLRHPLTGKDVHVSRRTGLIVQPPAEGNGIPEVAVEAVLKRHYPKEASLTGNIPGYVVKQAFDELYADIRAAARPHLGVPDGWKPIATAPKDGTPVLFAYSLDYDKSEVYPCVCWWSGAMWQGGPAGVPGFRPLAWQPVPTLPAAPQSEGEA